MNDKKRDVTLKFKDDSTIKEDETSKETIKNSIQDLHDIIKKLKEIEEEIKKCKSMERLDEKIDLKAISDDLGLIIQNLLVIDDPSFKKNVEEANQLYRYIEILYFNKKIEFLNNQVKAYDEIIKKSEENLKDITGGTLFSIASVFLGISLTSALVTGVQYVGGEFVLLYYITCLFIAVVTIGLSAIFMRKVDVKSIFITVIIAIISVVWFSVAYFSYSIYVHNQEIEEHNNSSNNIDDDISNSEGNY